MFQSLLEKDAPEDHVCSEDQSSQPLWANGQPPAS